MTGPELADRLEAFFAANPHISARRTTKVLGQGPTKYRGTLRPTPKTIAKVLAFMENPPPEAMKIDRLEQGARSLASRRANLAAGKTQPCDRKRREGNAARIRRQITDAAEKNLAAGVDPQSVKRRHVRHAMYAIQTKRAEEQWAEPQIMQAIVKLQKRFRPVCSATVVGGPKGFYVVGSRRVSAAELLEMAA